MSNKCEKFGPKNVQNALPPVFSPLASNAARLQSCAPRVREKLVEPTARRARGCAPKTAKPRPWVHLNTDIQFNAPPPPPRAISCRPRRPRTYLRGGGRYSTSRLIMPPSLTPLLLRTSRFFFFHILKDTPTFTSFRLVLCQIVMLCMTIFGVCHHGQVPIVAQGRHDDDAHYNSFDTNSRGENERMRHFAPGIDPMLVDLLACMEIKQLYMSSSK